MSVWFCEVAGGGEALPYLVHNMYHGIVRVALSHCAFSTSLVDFHTLYDQPFGPSARAFLVTRMASNNCLVGQFDNRYGCEANSSHTRGRGRVHIV